MPTKINVLLKFSKKLKMRKSGAIKKGWVDGEGDVGRRWRRIVFGLVKKGGKARVVDVSACLRCSAPPLQQPNHHHNHHISTTAKGQQKKQWGLLLKYFPTPSSSSSHRCRFFLAHRFVSVSATNKYITMKWRRQI